MDGEFERDPLIRELFALGLTIKEVAGLVDWSEATIALDLRRFGGMAEFPNRPEKRTGGVFQAMIKRYAEIVVAGGEFWNTPKLPDAALRDTLAKALRVDLIEAAIHGAKWTIEQLLVPAFDTGYRGYAKLLRASGTGRDDLLELVWGAGNVTCHWHWLLKEIVAEKTPVPKSKDMAVRTIVWHLLQDTRAFIQPIWDEDTFALIDSVLKDCLTEREYKVVVDRFGLNPEVGFLHDWQVAEQMKVSRERVRQIEHHALRKFRYRMTQQLHLKAITQPVGNALQCLLEKQRAKEAADKLTAEERLQLQASLALAIENPDPRLARLLKLMDAFEMSARTANCLNASITYVGELVQRTEAQLLHTKNFGRKSLTEIKAILGEMELTLAMHPATHPVVAQFIEEMRARGESGAK